MKKYAIIVVLFILFSCHPQQKISYVFDKSYTESEFPVLKTDFKEQLQKYAIDTATGSMENWNKVEFDTDSGKIMQRFYTKQINKDVYVFIYSAIIEKDSLFYEFKIRKEQ